MPALRAARMEQQIVEVPENEVVVSLGRSEAILAGTVGKQAAAFVHDRYALGFEPVHR